MEERKEVLRYYLHELAYLRRMGREFARDYPKVAARLELSDGVSSDPHVERLIESFAFLTARLERRLDLELPEISAALLGVLYPSLVNPVPPLAIARVALDPTERGVTSVRTIPRHTRLFAQTGEGAVCRFRTAYPVEVWPLEVDRRRALAPARVQGARRPSARGRGAARQHRGSRHLARRARHPAPAAAPARGRRRSPARSTI